ncbi:MAG: hypothetical protein ACRD2T_15115, partial [Thermoanaerobaculia bacterium]
LRGRASSAVKHEIEIRTRQDALESVRTVLYELYHPAQFHKWGDLHPRRRRLGPGDFERAESLAEVYARLAAKSLRRASTRSRRHR